MCFFVKFKINRLTKKLTALQKNRVHNQPSDEVLRSEIAGYHELSQLYMKKIGHKKFPFAQDMVTACYRAAAALDDVAAQFLLGQYFLDKAKFLEGVQKQSIFCCNANERECKISYEEAHAYLMAAEQLRHAQAKRLRGLCYINAWGVPEDKDKGFEMIVDSIEQEKSWDKVPQIFAALGLNKPEFFAALTQRRK